MSISLSPRDTGLYVHCTCGSRMFIPSESATRSPVLLCPCGEVEKIGKEVLNQLMSRQLRSHVSKKNGRLYRPAAKSEERTRETVASRVADEFVELQ